MASPAGLSGARGRPRLFFFSVWEPRKAATLSRRDGTERDPRYAKVLWERGGVWGGGEEEAESEAVR